VKTSHVAHPYDTDPYFIHLKNNHVSEKGINQETSTASWTQSKDLHDMGKFRVTKTHSHFFQFISHAKVDFLRAPALSASQMMVVPMFVFEAIDLRPIFADTALHNSGLFELLQAAVGRYQIASIGRQGGKCLLG
jgi:hypothetical protein